MTALAGRTALVTGASRGIGRAIADLFEREGALVVRVARTVTAERPLDALGPPDVLVNNAGTFLLKPAADTSAEEFRRQVDVNLVGGFLVLKALLPAMAERGGHVVTIGSVADHLGFPGNVAYGASKYGLRGLHESLRAEYAGQGVRMTLISPGPTDTTLWDPVDPDRRDDLPNRAGMLQPDDVAETVLFAVTRPDRANVELLHLMPS
jgi:NADP-dependent 3-hydroxy acid dehydrogenase YdfG